MTDLSDPPGTDRKENFTSSEKKDKSGILALRNVIGVIIVMLLLVPRPTIGLPLGGIAILFGLVYLVRRSFGWGRMVGGVVCAVLLLILLGMTGVVVHVQQTHYQLLAKLEQYKHVSVGREFLPYPYVSRLSVSGSVDDKELGTMIKMPKFKHLKDLYLESDNLTDACFQDVASIDDLRYLFIKVRAITDEAILAFEEEHPDCVVIAFGRDLNKWEHGFEVIDMR